MKSLLFILLVILFIIPSRAQYSIHGTVLDEEDQSLVGANIELSPIKRAVISDIKGHFKIENLEAGNYTLRISYVGFKTYRQSINLSEDLTLQVRMETSVYMTDEVIITSIRASDQTPATFSNVTKEEIEKRDLGQDMPYILNQIPSVFVTSDAGNGVGYTSMRIRGSDHTRINVTINGIPLNDSESHGVFWVDFPDLAASVENIQVQRGVGTSTNGAAAFGASVNIQAEKSNPLPYGQIDASAGSLNTRKITLQLGSGLIKNHFAFDARLSNIYSDGYIDRAFSDLKSYYLSGGYYGESSLIKLNVFSGKEQTYQAWWGTPEARVKGDQEALQQHIQRNWYTEEQINNLLNSGRTYNYYTYDNETDNYQQDHYQLILAQDLSDQITINGAIHYTYGRGYYEQYRENDSFADYSLPDLYFGYDSIPAGPVYTYFYNDTITSTDLIRQRWLDNDFYGFILSGDLKPSEKLQFFIGGGWNRYEGDHFGEIIWARFAGNTEIRHRYYDNSSEKQDLHIFGKGIYSFYPGIDLFLDLQYRQIQYNYQGIDNDQRFISGDHRFDFFNPKIGLTYNLNPDNSFYASYGIGNREPVRNDFIDAPAGRIPKHEKLGNLEVGYKRSKSNLDLQINYYLMNYENQLVLNGELNDVGASIRQNVDKSYRTGIEFNGNYKLGSTWVLNANLAYGWNKIRDFEEIMYNYDDNSVIINQYENTDISYSPDLIIGSNVTYSPFQNLNVSWISKYVGSQYLDNTSNDARKLDPFFVNDFGISYTLKPDFIQEINCSLMVYNLLNELYEPNGYTYSYIYGNELITENFLYPVAGINFMGGITVKF